MEALWRGSKSFFPVGSSAKRVHSNHSTDARVVVQATVYDAKINGDGEIGILDF